MLVPEALLNLLVKGLIYFLIYLIVGWVVGLVGLPPIITTMVGIILAIYFIYELIVTLR